MNKEMRKPAVKRQRAFLSIISSQSVDQMPQALGENIISDREMPLMVRSS